MPILLNQLTSDLDFVASVWGMTLAFWGLKVRVKGPCKMCVLHDYQLRRLVSID